MLGGAGEKLAGGVKTAWAVGGLPNCFQHLLADGFACHSEDMAEKGYDQPQEEFS